MTIIQYGDFQGQYDALLEPALRRIVKNHPGETRLVWRPYPLLDVNDKALFAAIAAEAARRQGRFWEMHDLLFDHYRDWADETPEKLAGMLDKYAADLGLDLTRLRDDLSSGEINQLLADDVEQARKVGVLGTPVLVINCVPYTGPLEYTTLETTIRLALLKPRQFVEYPGVVIDVHKSYTATLRTVKGDMTLTLFARQAPAAVNSFVFLARKGWYDGNTFYRVLPGRAAYTGDPSDTGLGGPGYLFAREIDSGLRFDAPGVVALNNAGQDTDGSQFFITFAPAPEFDGLYTIIGRVTSGLDVLSRLTPRDPQAQPDAPPGDTIDTVTVTEN
ncbi:MAG: peptidylprolyl isomerase [Chloroflexi bacterium]|nr:peptidylprolyl isomerase [Chloroflexota bacterium]